MRCQIYCPKILKLLKTSGKDIFCFKYGTIFAPPFLRNENEKSVMRIYSHSVLASF